MGTAANLEHEEHDESCKNKFQSVCRRTMF